MALPTNTKIEPAAAPGTFQKSAINPDAMKLSDIDGLLGELNQPKEQIFSTQPGASGEDTPLSGGLMDTPGPGFDEYQPESPAITPEEAARTGERIATTINTVFGFGASIFAKSDDRKEYEADGVDVGQLSKCWADVAMKHSFKIEDSPWLNLLILMSVIYAPIFIRAKNDRVQAIFREEMQAQRLAQEKINAKIQADIENLQNSAA